MLNKEVKLKFKRYELKYLISRAKMLHVLKMAKSFTDWDPYVKDKKQKAYQVTSLYYDSPTLSYYREKVDGSDNRKKIRLRTYEDTFYSEKPAFLEFKRKTGITVKKDRIMCSTQDAMDFLSRKANILSSNPASYLGDSSLITELQLEKLTRHLEPAVLISYTRIPLINSRYNNLRITFDYDILVKKYSDLETVVHNNGIIDSSKVVMEIKYNNSLPLWVHNLIQYHCLNRISFSKYCRGIERVFSL